MVLDLRDVTLIADDFYTDISSSIFLQIYFPYYQMRDGVLPPQRIIRVYSLYVEFAFFVAREKQLMRDLGIA